MLCGGAFAVPLGLVVVVRAWVVRCCGGSGGGGDAAGDGGACSSSGSLSGDPHIPWAPARTRWRWNPLPHRLRGEPGQCRGLGDRCGHRRRDRQHSRGLRPGRGGGGSRCRTVYVANELDDTVSVIDAATGTVTGTIPVGNGPDAVAVIPLPAPSTWPPTR